MCLSARFFVKKGRGPARKIDFQNALLREGVLTPDPISCGKTKIHKLAEKLGKSPCKRWKPGKSARFWPVFSAKPVENSVESVNNPPDAPPISWVLPAFSPFVCRCGPLHCLRTAWKRTSPLLLGAAGWPGPISCGGRILQGAKTIGEKLGGKCGKPSAKRRLKPVSAHFAMWKTRWKHVRLRGGIFPKSTIYCGVKNFSA